MTCPGITPAYRTARGESVAFFSTFNESGGNSANKSHCGADQRHALIPDINDDTIRYPVILPSPVFS